MYKMLCNVQFVYHFNDHYFNPQSYCVSMAQLTINETDINNTLRRRRNASGIYSKISSIGKWLRRRKNSCQNFTEN